MTKAARASACRRARRRIPTGSAAPANLDHRPHSRKPGLMRRIAQRSGQPVVINVRGLAASIANQEDAVVVAAGMAVRHIGVGAFHAPGKVGPHEQVQNSVNTVGRDSLAPARSDAFGNVIRGGRLFMCSQRLEHVTAHVGPLLTSRLQGAACRIDQHVAGKIVMGV